jgi:putative flippase GtrA
MAAISPQFLRYALVGLSINAGLYIGYLLLTHTFLSIQAAMTVTYVGGVLIGFLLNRSITFRFVGDNGLAFLRYLGAYVIGYVINYLGLWLLVGRGGFPHEIVQGGMVLGIPLILFLLQRHWVFPDRASRRAVRLARPSP